MDLKLLRKTTNNKSLYFSDIISPLTRLEELERTTTVDDRQSVTFKTIRIKIPKDETLNVEELYKISNLDDSDKIVAIDGRNIDSIR